MRILLAGTGIQPIPPPGYGGVERTIAEYARALTAAGHTPIVVNTVRKRRTLDEYWFARELPALLRRETYDIVHASTPVVANRLAGIRQPYVYTSHSRHWFDRDHLGAHWGYFLERRAVSRSAGTVALTDRLKAAMTAAVRRPPAELRTIPIGVDVERFAPDLSNRTGKIALGVGLVAPFKRWHIAARALRGTGIALRIVGPIPDGAYARTVREAGDAVGLLGEVDDAALVREYASADLLVHPSRVELLAGVVLQGMASGLPVIGAAPVAGLAEDGVSGWSAPANASEEGLTAFFRDHAVQLAGDPSLRSRMSEAARRRAIAEFSWSSVVDRHMALYDGLRTSGALGR
ncbi:MAG: glycosyltransferase family 4 protein [Thermoplasmata archaeon]|nr:glycosyltransferase family 4 protein [Thermoplasmata archaeon]